MHDTINGSLILILLISNIEPKPPITSFSYAAFVFLTSFFDNNDICFTSLLANEIFTPLFCNYFVFFSLIKMIFNCMKIILPIIFYINCFFKNWKCFMKTIFFYVNNIEIEKKQNYQINQSYLNNAIKKGFEELMLINIA